MTVPFSHIYRHTFSIGRTLTFVLILIAATVYANGNKPTATTLGPLCDLELELPMDTHLCKEGNFDLCANYSAPTSFVEILWLANGEETNYDLCEDVFVDEDVEFTLRATYTSEDNLIINGDFEDGDNDFDTPYLNLPGPCTGFTLCDGYYAIWNDTGQGHPAFASCSHNNPSSSQLMAVNGIAGKEEIWCQDVCLDPDASYLLSGYGTSFHPDSPAELQFSVDGDLIGDEVNLTSNLCDWQNFTAEFDADGQTSVQICVYNQNPDQQGNDFAIDDISVYQVCTAEESVMVTVSDMELNIGPVFELSCLLPAVEVKVDILPVQNYSAITWTTTNGVIDSEDGERIQVSAPGIYSVVVTDEDGCDFTTEVEVMSSASKPTAQITGDTTLNCTRLTTTLMATTTVLTPLYEWTDSLGVLLGNQSMVLIDKAGAVNLRIIDPNSGCFITATDFVTIDTLAATFELIKSSDLTCNTSSVLLHTSTLQDSVNWSSSLAAPISTTNDTLLVSQAADYYASVIKPNGCIFIDTISVIGSTPNFDYSSSFIKDLDCLNTSSEINIIFDPSLYTITWTGNASSYGSNNPIIVTQEGRYHFTLADQNGCTLSDSIEIFENFFVPELIIYADIITCSNPTSNITLFWMDQNIYPMSVLWTFPDGTNFIGGITTTTIQPGWHHYLATMDWNSCTYEDSIFVVASNDFPELSLDWENLNCDNIDTEINATTGIGVVDLVWTLPDNSTATGNTLLVDEAGIYIAQATSSSGCMSTAEALVIGDFSSPEISPIPSSILGCTTTSVSPMPEILSPYAALSWTGPGVMTNDLSFETTLPGTYSLTVTGTNGCTSISDYLVTVDTFPPTYVLSPPETLSCSNNSFMPSVFVDQTYARYFSWQFPGGAIADSFNINITEPGSYFLTVSRDGGCAVTEEYVVEQATDLPEFMTVSSPVTCTNTMTDIIAQATDPTIVFSYINSLTDQELATGNSVTLPSDIPITVIATDQNGCTAVNDLILLYDTLAPSFVVTSDQLGCQVNGVLVEINSTAQIDNIEIYDANQLLLGDENFLIDVAGDYFISGSGMNGCLSVESLTVDTDTSKLTLSFDPDILDCNKTSASLNMQTSGEFDNAALVDASGQLLDQIVFGEKLIDVESAGLYDITVLSTNGCTTEAQVEIIEDISLIDFTLSADDLSCNISSSQIEITNSDPFSDGYATNTTTQEILTNLDELFVSEAGTYDVVLIGMNGCESLETITVEESIDTPELETWSVKTLDCEGTAELDISLIIGGEAPYTLRIDNGQEEPAIGMQLLQGIGQHSLIITDANGCTSENMVEVEPVDPVTANIIPELTISEASNRTLNLELNKPLSEIETISWTPAINLDCYDCINPTFTGDNSMDYLIEVTDIYGCEVTATINILISATEEPSIYIPNMLDLNSSADNKFNIFASEEEVLITELSIYDRWGNQVFINNNFMANDLSAGWDGTFNNKRVLPGVYIYYASMLKANGETDVYAGDLTIVR